MLAADEGDQGGDLLVNGGLEVGAGLAATVAAGGLGLQDVVLLGVDDAGEVLVLGMEAAGLPPVVAAIRALGGGEQAQDLGIVGDHVARRNLDEGPAVGVDVVEVLVQRSAVTVERVLAQVPEVRETRQERARDVPQSVPTDEASDDIPREKGARRPCRKLGRVVDVDEHSVS